jgi:hypothetical protein
VRKDLVNSAKSGQTLDSLTKGFIFFLQKNSQTRVNLKQSIRLRAQFSILAFMILKHRIYEIFFGVVD